jgi:hypothetical protein
MRDIAASIQAEVTEIAEVLAREQGRPIRDVWEEALSLHRVRYEREVRSVGGDPAGAGEKVR